MNKIEKYRYTTIFLLVALMLCIFQLATIYTNGSGNNNDVAGLHGEKILTTQTGQALIISGESGHAICETTGIDDDSKYRECKSPEEMFGEDWGGEK